MAVEPSPWIAPQANKKGTVSSVSPRRYRGSLSGQRFGYFVKDGRQFDVVAQLTRDFRSQPQDLDHLYVRAAGGELVGLANLGSLTESSARPELYRYNRCISATISADTLAAKGTYSRPWVESQPEEQVAFRDWILPGLFGTFAEQLAS